MHIELNTRRISENTWSKRHGALRRMGAVLVALSALTATACTSDTEEAADPTLDSPGGANSPPVQSIRMVRTGFDVAIANQYGYQIVDKDGRLESVKVSDAPILQEELSAVSLAAPVEQIICGVATLVYDAVGPQQADVVTGFSLITVQPAISVVWKLAAADYIGVGSDRFLAYPFRWDWVMTWHTVHGTTGYSYAILTSGTIYLPDGTICTAEGAWDDTWLY